MTKNDLIVWSTVQWVQNNFEQIGLAIIYSLCLMTVFAVVNKKVRQRRKQAERERTVTEDDSLSIRKFSRFESSLDHLHKFGGSITAFALILKSKSYINPSLVKSALVYLTKKNEILRTKISRKKIRTNGKKKVEKEWKIMDNPDFAEFHLKLKAMTSDQWPTVFERELMKQFPEEGPLWRFVMLKEQFNHGEGRYSQSFVLSAHHLVCDGYSGFAFFKDFMGYINTTLSAESIEHDVIHPVRPSLPDLLRNHIHVPQTVILYSMFTLFLKRIADRLRPKPKCKNLYTSMYPPVITASPSAVKKTCFIPRYFNKDDTRKLLKMCKANHCTIHGAFSAIATISMATILQKGRSGAPLIIPSSFSVDLRKECNPVVNQSKVGFYSVDCNIEIPCEFTTLPLDTKSLQFWEFTQKCDLILRNAIQNGDHLYSLKLMETLRINTAKNRGELAKDPSTAGRTSALFHITNIGKRSVLESTVDLNVEGFYFGLAEHNIGPVFSNNIATVNGALYWGFTYFSHIMRDAQALEYVDLVMDILKGRTS